MALTNFAEQDCTIEHQGKTFTAGGAVVAEDFLIAYPGIGHELTDWHGRPIGSYRVISSRPAIFFGHRSWQGDRYYHMRARLYDGREYAIRGFGEGMVAKGKRIKGT